MLDVFILAFALAMDAFAVSIGLGSKKIKSTFSLALMSGVYFGVFQGLMPLIGYAGGVGVFGWIENYAPWIAFILLLFIGLKMIYEGLTEEPAEDVEQFTHRVMLVLAVATSIDALAAGFTLTLLAVNPYVSCIIIGVVTFLISVLGVYVGDKSGTWLESKAEVFGGIVLVLIGVKVLLF